MPTAKKKRAVTKASPKRVAPAQLLVRLTPEEKGFVEEAAARKAAEISRAMPGASYGLTAFARAALLKSAEEVLGRSLQPKSDNEHV